VLPTTKVGGCVTDMSGKIIRAVGDVGVPVFWLDPTLTSAGQGGGNAALRESPFMEVVLP
jgi:hypothetical protein